MNDTQRAWFYFANLGADVARCVSAALVDDNDRFDKSFARMRKRGELRAFDKHLNRLVMQYTSVS